MGSGFDVIDLDSFFETGPQGMAVVAEIDDGMITVAGIFDLAAQDVALAAETGVDTDEPMIECRTTDVVTVKRGMLLTMPDLQPHEDGYGKTYKVVRIAGAMGPQTTRLYLTEV